MCVCVVALMVGVKMRRLKQSTAGVSADSSSPHCANYLCVQTAAHRKKERNPHM